MVQFAGKTLSEEDIIIVAQECSFKRLQQNRLVNKPLSPLFVTILSGREKLVTGKNMYCHKSWYTSVFNNLVWTEEYFCLSSNHTDLECHHYDVSKSGPDSKTLVSFNKQFCLTFNLQVLLN